jgi:hypothetical protein
MKTSMKRKTWACALVLLTAACGEREGDFNQSLALRSEAVGIDHSLVMVSETSNKAFVLDLEALGAPPKVLELPSNPALLDKRNEADEALILCKGQRGTAYEDAEPSVLTVITAKGSMREYTLGSPFDAIEQSGDGRYALAYRTKSSSDRLLENPNEIAIVDLEADADADDDDKDAVHNRTLRSFGDAPSKIVFSPPMDILGEKRRLAVVLSTRNVTLIDLAHLDREETTVQLSQEIGSAVSPTQVLFSTTDPVLYVRGSTADDLYAFDLTARPGGIEDDDGGLHNDFRPTINQLGVGARPSDMALYESSDGARLLTLTDSGLSLAVVNTSTGQATNVPVASHAHSLLVFDAPSPRDDTVAPRALLYDIDSTVVTFVDLADIEERRTRNLDPLTLDRTVRRLIPMLSESLVLAIHDEGVSLIDLASRTVSPISSNVQLEDALFDEAGRRFWVGPDGQPWVGVLDLETGTPGEVLLDAPIRRLVPLFDAGLIAVMHESNVGHVTVIDLDQPDRKNARSVRGFLLAAALDRGEP